MNGRKGCAISKKSIERQISDDRGTFLLGLSDLRSLITVWIDFVTVIENHGGPVQLSFGISLPP
ncbi:MAG TPA: hypothetical protein VEP29_05860 [Desulfatiglandales bacterium]|nr:hypothetical protein [Desulfatiglandales bacterium]